jgi:hypothetical protein
MATKTPRTTVKVSWTFWSTRVEHNVTFPTRQHAWKQVQFLMGQNPDRLVVTRNDTGMQTAFIKEDGAWTAQCIGRELSDAELNDQKLLDA